MKESKIIIIIMIDEKIINLLHKIDVRIIRAELSAIPARGPLHTHYPLDLGRLFMQEIADKACLETCYDSPLKRGKSSWETI